MRLMVEFKINVQFQESTGRHLTVSAQPVNVIRVKYNAIALLEILAANVRPPAGEIECIAIAQKSNMIYIVFYTLFSICPGKAIRFLQFSRVADFHTRNILNCPNLFSELKASGMRVRRFCCRMIQGNRFKV